MQLTQQTQLKIGFIGAGSMGLPMIGHLIRAGHVVTAFARSDATQQAVLAVGAAVAHSYAQCAQDAHVVFTNVTTTQDVEQCLIGADGVMHHAQQGLLCIDMSTISVTATKHIAQALAHCRIEFLDCPVSGGTVAAQQASLSIMVGGPESTLQKALPLLQLLGQRITHIGPHGTGQVAKACNQIAQLVNIQGVAEALSFAKAQGVALNPVFNAISAGMAGSRMLDLMAPKMISGDFSAGIQSRLHAKDIAMVVEQITELGLNAPATRLVNQQLALLQSQGDGQRDTSALFNLLNPTSRER